MEKGQQDLRESEERETSLQRRLDKIEVDIPIVLYFLFIFLVGYLEMQRV